MSSLDGAQAGGGGGGGGGDGGGGHRRRTKTVKQYVYFGDITHQEYQQ